MADFYKKVRDAAARQGVKSSSRKAQDWYRKKVKDLARGVGSRDILSKGPFSSRPGIGYMYFYFYDPKTKEKLPYYDTFPLTIVIEKYKDGFLGLNLHYLPPKTRGLVMAKLIEISEDGKMNDKTKLKLTYSFLKNSSKLKELKPCIKRYLYPHLRSKMVKVSADDWLTAVFLPVQQFQKASNSKVWSDSRLKM